VVVSEASGPLSSVGAGCQPFPACESFGASRSLKALLAELLVIVLAKAGFLKVTNLNVDGGDFFIEVSESGNIGGDTPIIELSSRRNHGEELGVWAVDNGSEPAQECFNGFISGMGGGGIDGNDVGRILGPIVGREGGDFTVVKTFDPFSGEVEAGPNGDLEQGKLVVFDISFQGVFVNFLVFADFVSESPNLVSKVILSSSVCVLPIFACLDEAVDDAT
jgi:hypothetical protein